MDKLMKAFASQKGVVNERSLAFLIEGERIDINDTPQMLDLEDEDSIDCVLMQTGMISTFTSSNTSDALINYLMLTDEERVTAKVPVCELKEKERSENAENKQFTYKQNPDILHPSQLDILCELLDFVWRETTIAGVDRVDIRLTLTSDQFAVVRILCANVLLFLYLYVV